MALPNRRESSPESGMEPSLFVAGVDEAGRGPLAGPVVAAAVILGGETVVGLDDSKQLSARQREELYHLIVERCPAVAWGVASPRKIDRINVLQATLHAMKAAVEGLPYAPDIVHVDGNRSIPGLATPQRTLVGGDGRCPAVAAASIVAKVVRDRIMHALSWAYPRYRFDIHKGYGTKDHLLALERYGPSPVHRFSFGPVQRQSLFPSR